ncbi:ankyrin repeat protein [Colletotrichum truncatum]|uniref:Ankyrin repeat protein n=1 Tax=Colletotrichum truncatum TaxID=5467 RepID=A0ACC3Z843_COLTU|nr:ankyrin repeat protein [Colletotrichum truncatum]KAF6783651.1 ankyrin repeat protein [Colletotrichum truncatum]
MSEPPAGNRPAAQTGRPSLWTQSAERKLARLYVYTTLPLVKIVEVVHKASPGNGDCPGTDSANKKLNAILDKEPRWLHPRTRSDMDRRIGALDSSPTRQTPPENAFSPNYGFPASPGSRSLLSVNREFKEEAGNSPTIHDIQSYTNSRASSAGWNPGASGPLPTLITPEYVSAPRPEEVGVRRTATTLTLGDVLSEYSAGFIHQVSKLLKRYTMPNNSMLDQSSTDEDRPGTADSNPASWIVEYDAPQRSGEMDIRPLPGDFLTLHHQLHRQGACLPGLREHDTRSCYCHVRDELTDECWVSDMGPGPFAQHVLLEGRPVNGDFASRDVFGNTILHLLAAGDAHHGHLINILTRDVSPNPSAVNSAHQTFMHVLNDSWFSGPVNDLVNLINVLKRQKFDFQTCDVYGRNFCHIIHAKDARILNQAMKNNLLGLFNPMEYCRRDAFGNIPESATPGHVRRAHTTAVGQEMSPTWNAQTQRQLSSPIEQQASLLRTVNQAFANPRVQDSQGRNGLHCLADAILSTETLLSKFPEASRNDEQQQQQQQQTSPVSRKRKHNKPVLQKSLDSSKERLTARETMVRNLIQAGVDPNHYDKYGNTVLMAFVAQLPEDDDYKKPVAILEFLIQAGANVNARNRAGETALHIAVRRGKKLAMRTLTQNGANVQARDVEGRSVLDVADRMVVSGRHGIDHPRYEACHAWLSGQGKAVQNPTIQLEWKYRE